MVEHRGCNDVERPLPEQQRFYEPIQRLFINRSTRFPNVSRETFSAKSMFLTPPRTSAKTPLPEVFYA
jgi:hypothetical protein